MQAHIENVIFFKDSDLAMWRSKRATRVPRKMINGAMNQMTMSFMMHALPLEGKQRWRELALTY